MTDKERLEEIEKCIKHDLVHNDGMMISVCYAEIRWLIKQVERKQELEEVINTHAPHGRNYTNDQYVRLMERVQELEEQKLALIEEMGQVDERFLDLEQQNKKLREALEYINEELELVLHFNKGLAEKMFYIENSKRKITEVLEDESNEQRTAGRIKKDEVIV